MDHYNSVGGFTNERLMQPLPSDYSHPPGALVTERLSPNRTLAESVLSSARAAVSQALDRFPSSASRCYSAIQQSEHPAAKALTRLTADPRLHDLANRALAAAEPYTPHLVGIVGVLLAFYLSSRSSRREQDLYEAQLRRYNERMNNDYGLGSSSVAGGAASGTSTPRGGGEQRAKDDHGEVEVQWGREKLRVPLPPPSSPLSHFRATLYNMTGVPPSHQKLIYAGAVLKDDLLPMSAYGLVESDPSSTPSSSDPNAAETSSSSKGRSFWDSWSLMGRKSANNKKGGLKKLVMLGSATVSARVDDHLATRKDLKDLAAASPSGSVASAPSTTTETATPGGGEDKKVDSEETVQSRIRQIAVHKLDELEPQVKQVETWLAQEQARRQRRQQQPDSSTTREEEEEDDAAPPPPKRLLLYLSENLLQGLLKLDSIEVPSGYTEARKDRKEAVRKVQEVLDRVDGAKDGWKQLGLSFS